MQLEGKIINFLGDSITEGARVEDPANIYTNRMKELCDLRAANNYGIGGTRIARQSKPSENARWDKDFCSRMDDMDPNADIIVVMGGTNDFGHGDAPIGQMSDRTSDTFYGACHYLMSGLVARYPGKPVVICTPFHRLQEDNVCGTHGGSIVYGDLKTYVGILREVAEYYALPVLDFYAMSGLQPAIPVIVEKFMPDGLHLNDAGHAIVAERMTAFLKAL